MWSIHLGQNETPLSSFCLLIEYCYLVTALNVAHCCVKCNLFCADSFVLNYLIDSLLIQAQVCIHFVILELFYFIVGHLFRLKTLMQWCKICVREKTVVSIHKQITANPWV